MIIHSPTLNALFTIVSTGCRNRHGEGLWPADETFGEGRERGRERGGGGGGGRGGGGGGGGGGMVVATFAFLVFGTPFFLFAGLVVSSVLLVMVATLRGGGLEAFVTTGLLLAAAPWL